ncbi:MAG: SigE family RNA polymerase sigma factor [Actinomycetota bacterium]|nr:SigE family RNA polymerase sigma factor [Actinomycetota bacterium]
MRIAAASGERGETARVATRPDRAAVLSELFDQNFSSLRRLAFALLGDASAADEVAQDAFVRLYASWQRLDELDHPPSYLRKIVLNLCRTRGRRAALQQRSQPLVGQGDVASDPDVALRLDVWRAIERLPQRQRACVVLRYLEDLPEADVAQLLECSVGTVKSQLHKARAKLEAALGSSTGEDA